MFISHRYKAIFIHIQRTGGNSIQTSFEQHDPDLVKTIEIDPGKQRTKHCFATDIRAAVGNDIFESYTKFCVMRNPFERMVSWYAMFKEGWGRDAVAIKANSDSRLLKLYDRGLPLVHRRPWLATAYVRAWTRLFVLSRRFEPNSAEDIAVRHLSIGARVMAEVNKRASTFEEFVMLPREHPLGLFERLYVNQVDYVSDDGRVLVDHVLRFETLSRDFRALARALSFPGDLPHVNRSRRTSSYREYYTPTTRALIGQRFQRDLEFLGLAV